MKKTAKGYYVITKMIDGVRKYFYGKTQKEVKEKQDAFFNSKEKQKRYDESMLYNEWLNIWLDSISPNLTLNTIQSYNNMINAHLRKPLGNYSLCDMNAPLLKDFMNAKQKQNYSSRTLQYIFVLLKASLKQAVIDDLLIKNPCDKLTKPKLTNKKKIVALTKPETEKLLGIIDDTKFYNIIFLDLRTGLRRSELLGLRWKDIDFKNKTLTVEQTVLKLNGITALSQTTKNKSSNRTIALDTKALDVLSRQKRIVLEERIRNIDYHNNSLVFPNSDGTPTNPDTVTRKTKRYAIAANLPVGFTFHSLRHTHATLLLKAGVNFKVIQARLGHANFQVTMDTYSHVSPEHDNELVEKIAAVF